MLALVRCIPLGAVALLTGCTAFTMPDHYPTDIAQIVAANSEVLGPIARNPEAHRLQIRLAIVDENDGRPTLRVSDFRTDAEYFYPASTVKTVAAIAALRFLDSLRTDNGWDIDRDTPLAYHPLFDDEVFEDSDASNVNDSTITVGHQIRKLAIVSDNTAYNRLFELVGPKRINQEMQRFGLRGSRLYHRLSEARTREQNLLTPRIDFVTGSTTYTLDATDDNPWSASPRGPRFPQTDDTVPIPADNREIAGILVGDQHIAGGETVPGPMDFATKNQFALEDLQNMLVMLTRPDIDIGLPRIELSAEDRAFLVDAMTIYPGQSTNPVYNDADYPDTYVKNFLAGIRRLLPDDEFKIINKTGLAYGFTLDNSCIVHLPTGRTFYLAAVTYTNPNKTVNDGDYGYTELADPFFADLGQVVAQTVWPELRPRTASE